MGGGELRAQALGGEARDAAVVDADAQVIHAAILAAGRRRVK